MHGSMYHFRSCHHFRWAEGVFVENEAWPMQLRKEQIHLAENWRKGAKSKAEDKSFCFHLSLQRAFPQPSPPPHPQPTPELLQADLPCFPLCVSRTVCCGGWMDGFPLSPALHPLPRTRCTRSGSSAPSHTTPCSSPSPPGTVAAQAEQVEAVRTLWWVGEPFPCGVHFPKEMSILFIYLLIKAQYNNVQ